MAGLRVVLDTNVLISALAYPASVPGRLLSAFHQGAIDLVLSRYILDEMARVLLRLAPPGWSSDKIRQLTDSFMLLAEIVEPDERTVAELRDPADQRILGTFRAAQARYLITGDKDLLALADRFPILTPAEFWRLHGE